MTRKKIIIMGAAGRDFHNFNVVYRDNEEYEVAAFTATQIPGIEGRKYPAELAGKLYPQGIKIYDEVDLPKLIKEYQVDEVIFSYSDVPYKYVMNKSALINALGANFTLLSYDKTAIKSTKPVISICATRTGCGKSQTTRYVYDIFKKLNKKVVAIRHPMPYGDLAAQKVQRFAQLDDLAKHECTIEEMEEYEPHIAAGNVIYAGVDYEAIVRTAEETDNPDIILWDGGNNDMPFYKSDLQIVIVDPHRPGDEENYYPGEVNLRMADIVIINKMDSAKAEDIKIVKQNIKKLTPTAQVVEADSELLVDSDLKGKKVLVVEDGPSLTHGGMKYGAAAVAAQRAGAEMIDPKPAAVGKIKETYQKYPEIGQGILPAMGYSDEQKKDLETTINNIKEAEIVLSGTPIDLARIVKSDKPIIRVGYELKARPGFENIIEDAMKKKLSL
ncbi:GTPase [Patescibacteria group bacterium]|nr:GTPase [Patescibacteria group bacterium]